MGDDDDEPVYQAVLAALRTLSERMAVFFIAGNRDFLVGERFAAATGCQVLADPTRIDLYGTPTLLMHGDSLCTEDTAYQTLRAQLRNPHWQQQFLAQPLAQRRAAARALRERSISDSAAKAEAIMDVTPQAVKDVMRQHGVTRLIHGHTHRPAIHDFQLDGQPVQRMVLGDWSAQGSV